MWSHCENHKCQVQQLLQTTAVPPYCCFQPGHDLVCVKMTVDNLTLCVRCSTHSLHSSCSSSSLTDCGVHAASAWARKCELWAREEMWDITRVTRTGPRWRLTAHSSPGVATEVTVWPPSAARDLDSPQWAGHRPVPALVLSVLPTPERSPGPTPLPAFHRAGVPSTGYKGENQHFII